MKRNARKDSFLSVTLTKTNFAVCIAALLCLFGVFFAFGQWFGKSYDGKLQGDNKKTKNYKSVFLLNNEKENIFHNSKEKKFPKIKKEFYETLKEDREDEVDQLVKLNLGENKTTTVSIKNTPVNSNNLRNINENKVKSKKNPLEVEYSLQIASFRNLRRANDILEKLKYKGFSAYVQIADLGERGKWYRVRVDVPSVKGALKDLKKRLKKDLNISKIQIIKN